MERQNGVKTCENETELNEAVKKNMIFLALKLFDWLKLNVYARKNNKNHVFSISCSSSSH